MNFKLLPKRFRFHVLHCIVSAFCALLLLSALPSRADTMQTMNNPAAVELVPFKEPWPSAKLRWWDIENNPFDEFLRNVGQSGQFNYTTPSATQSVRVTYDKAPAPGYFKGYVEARGLKPNFAYQIKLAGKPVRGKRGWGAYGDDLSNERMGYVGRWWCDSSHITQTNYDDTHYVDFYKNAPDAGVHDIYGYLFMGIFVTDEFGNANANFNGQYSYHITRQSWQSGAKQVVAGTWPVQSQISPYYGYSYRLDPAPVELWYEYEHNMNPARPLIASLPTGEYNCRLMLTEETFHNNFGGGTNSSAGGFWQTVLASEDFAKDSNDNYLTDISGNLLPDSNPSNDVTFTIGVPPMITTQPSSKIVCSGEAASFSVASIATGPISFQWRKGTTALVNGGNIAGADTNTLTISPTTVSNAATNYNVLVTSYYGAVASASASLAVNALTAISTQPVSQSASTGGVVSLRVTATGSNLSYQWRRGSTPLNNGGNISGANTAVLSINPVSAADVATDYNVLVSGACNSVTSNNASFSIASPVVSSFSPAGGAVGALVTINGKYLGGATSVRFNGLEGTFTALSAAKITAIVPANALSGPISVTSQDGTANSTSSFSVAPRLNSFSPGNGIAGAAITVTGENLGASNTTVKLNGVNATISSRSATNLTFKVPNSAISGLISVTNSGGTTSSTSSFLVLPKITSFTPSVGDGGTVVTITGYGLSNTTAVLFDTKSASFTVTNANSVTATAPTGVTNGQITVTTVEGNSMSTTSFTAPPRLNSFSPDNGVAGAVITVSGENLGASNTTVKVNGIAATVSSRAANSLTFTVPTSAATGKISVTNSAGTATSASTFTVLPKITSFTPTKAKVGTLVSVIGTTLGSTSAVLFTGISAPPVSVSSTKVTVIVPPNSASGRITVVTPTGNALSATDFTVLP